MIALLRFEEKVHRKDLARAEAIPLLMPRLLCQVLKHLGFPEEPRIERRLRCPLVLSLERSLSIPLSFILQQQEEVVDDYAEDLPGVGSLFQIYLLQFHLLLPQLLLRLLAHPPHHRSHQSTSLVLLGISWLFWMRSQH